MHVGKLPKVLMQSEIITWIMLWSDTPLMEVKLCEVMTWVQILRPKFRSPCTWTWRNNYNSMRSTCTCSIHTRRRCGVTKEPSQRQVHVQCTPLPGTTKYSLPPHTDPLTTARERSVHDIIPASLTSFTFRNMLNTTNLHNVTYMTF